jgi:hypothetical protein
LINRRQHFGQHHRIPVWQNQDARA